MFHFLPNIKSSFPNFTKITKKRGLSFMHSISLLTSLTKSGKNLIWTWEEDCLLGIYFILIFINSEISFSWELNWSQLKKKRLKRKTNTRAGSSSWVLINSYCKGFFLFFIPTLIMLRTTQTLISFGFRLSTAHSRLQFCAPLAKYVYVDSEI